MKFLISYIWTQGKTSNWPTHQTSSNRRPTLKSETSFQGNFQITKKFPNTINVLKWTQIYFTEHLPDPVLIQCFYILFHHLLTFTPSCKDPQEPNSAILRALLSRATRWDLKGLSDLQTYINIFQKYSVT